MPSNRVASGIEEEKNDSDIACEDKTEINMEETIDKEVIKIEETTEKAEEAEGVETLDAAIAEEDILVVTEKDREDITVKIKEI